MRALCAYITYIPMGILCCNVLDYFWICEIPISQNKARKTPFSICLVFTPTRKTYSLSVGKYGKTFVLRRKITTFFWDMQIYLQKSCRKVDFYKNVKSLHYTNNSRKSDFRNVSIGIPSSPTNTERWGWKSSWKTCKPEVSFSWLLFTSTATTLESLFTQCY